MFAMREAVTHAGRPAVIITEPAVGATGATVYGVRYLDCEQWEAVPGFAGMLRPALGSSAIVHAEEIRKGGSNV